MSSSELSKFTKKSSSQKNSKITTELLNSIYMFMQKPAGTRTVWECRVISSLL